MTVAVIGAGLAGLTAARALADAGRRVVVFEKSRGLGGRLATRRTSEGWWFNHGAPALTTLDPPWRAAPAFLDFLARAEAAGHAARDGDGHIGRPGASGVVAGLAEGLDIRFGVEVEPLARAGGGWRAGGARCAAVVCTAPAPQTARLCAAVPTVRAAAEAARMAPVWTLMAAWRGTPPPLRLAAPFFSVSVDQTSGGREGARWVAHAGTDWSAANLERDRDETARILAAELAAACGADPADLAFAQAHRWRFGLVAQPVGAPCVAAEGVVAAGDWLLGPRAADAHASGLAAAAALL